MTDFRERMLEGIRHKAREVLREYAAKLADPRLDGAAVLLHVARSSNRVLWAASAIAVVDEALACACGPNGDPLLLAEARIEWLARSAAALLPEDTHNLANWAEVRRIYQKEPK